MKKITLILLSVMLLGLTNIYAQKKTGYTIKSKVTVDGITDPNVLAQLPEETVEYMLGNYTKSVMSMQGVNVITITNGTEKSVTMIYDITGMGKYVIDITNESAESSKNMDIKYNYTGEKKDIAGYSCEKVIVKMTNLEDDETNELTLYVSKDLNPSADVNFVNYKGLEGYPLRTEVAREANGESFTMITEAFEVKADKKIKEVEFMKPSDGKEMSLKEFMKLMGQGDDEDDE